jgi:arylsulfatase A-like enzyme
MPVIILVADGARPDTLSAAMDRGELPALAAMRAEGYCGVATTVWPSVTGVAYVPMLMGRFPGGVGLPGLRWFDRERRVGRWLGHTRSYVGVDGFALDADLDPAAPTMFELTERRLGALSVIRRGLPGAARLDGGLRFALRVARSHFFGTAMDWMDIDRDIGRRLVDAIQRNSPEFVFAAFTGIDKNSHATAHDAPAVTASMQVVDGAIAAIRAAAERAGHWDRTQLWVVSDHGHSPVHTHDDLAVALAQEGWRVLAHPWVWSKGADVGVMVSGNAMAHLYLDVPRRERPRWSVLATRYQPLVDALLQRPSVDLVIRALEPGVVEVLARDRGAARIEHVGATYAYRPVSGDPLGLGEVNWCDAWEAHAATFDSAYPDAIVQIAQLVAAPRSGDVLLSAARGFDFRARYEPHPHRSTHGALLREHMLVPLLTNHPLAQVPRRTVDLMPSALAALGRALPPSLDGRPFL